MSKAQFSASRSGPAYPAAILNLPSTRNRRREGCSNAPYHCYLRRGMIDTPPAPADRDESVEDQSDPAAATRPDLSRTILVVDDIDGVRDLVREVLELDGYEVLLAEDGAHALQVAREHAGRIHLLLTDVVMPNMGGKELADHLIRERPEIKVVFMSGYSDEAIARHGVLQPGTILIKKPFSSDLLTSCVREQLTSV